MTFKDDDFLTLNFEKTLFSLKYSVPVINTVANANETPLIAKKRNLGLDFKLCHREYEAKLLNWHFDTMMLRDLNNNPF